MREPNNTNTVSSFEFDYRAVIALNNMGLVMMERSCYEQALKILQYAAFLLPQQADDSYNDTVNSKLLFLHNQRRCLDLAHSYAANPRESRYCVPVVVLSHDAVVYSAEFGEEATFASVIRIESEDVFSSPFETTTTTIDLDFLKLIVLYNLSAAQMCQSSNEMNVHRKNELYQCAIHLLLFCHRRLQTIFEDDLDHQTETILSMPIKVALPALVLRLLVPTLRLLFSSSSSSSGPKAVDPSIVTDLLKANARLCHVSRIVRESKLYPYSNTFAPAA